MVTKSVLDYTIGTDGKKKKYKYKKNIISSIPFNLNNILIHSLLH